MSKTTVRRGWVHHNLRVLQQSFMVRWDTDQPVPEWWKHKSREKQRTVDSSQSKPNTSSVRLWWRFFFCMGVHDNDWAPKTSKNYRWLQYRPDETSLEIRMGFAINIWISYFYTSDHYVLLLKIEGVYLKTATVPTLFSWYGCKHPEIEAESRY